MRVGQLFAALLLLLFTFALGLLLRPTLVNALFPSKVTLVGSAERLVHTPNMAGASGLPPEGLYVASSALDFVYFRCTDAAPAEGGTVRVRGTVDTVCGPDTIPCYPRVTGECSESDW